MSFLIYRCFLCISCGLSPFTPKSSTLSPPTLVTQENQARVVSKCTGPRHSPVLGSIHFPTCICPCHRPPPGDLPAKCCHCASKTSFLENSTEEHRHWGKEPSSVDFPLRGQRERDGMAWRKCFPSDQPQICT